MERQSFWEKNRLPGSRTTTKGNRHSTANQLLYCGQTLSPPTHWGSLMQARQVFVCLFVVFSKLSNQNNKCKMCWFKNSIETCILPCVKQIASPGLMHETGRSGPVHWDDPEGWDGEGGEREFMIWNTCTPLLIHVNVWQKHYNIVK